MRAVCSSPCRRCARGLQRAESWRSGRTWVGQLPHRSGRARSRASWPTRQVLGFGIEKPGYRRQNGRHASLRHGPGHPTPRRRPRLADHGPPSHASGMFVVSEAEAAAIRTAFEQSGELAAAVELRRLFPGHHRHRRGPRVRSDHCRLEAAAHTATSGIAAAPWRGSIELASRMLGPPPRPRRTSGARRSEPPCGQHRPRSPGQVPWSGCQAATVSSAFGLDNPAPRVTKVAGLAAAWRGSQSASDGRRRRNCGGLIELQPQRHGRSLTAGGACGAYRRSRGVATLTDFAKASEVIEMTGFEDLEASQHSISNLL